MLVSDKYKNNVFLELRSNRLLTLAFEILGDLGIEPKEGGVWGKDGLSGV